MARVPPFLPLHLSLFHGTCVSSLSFMFMSIDMLSGSYFDCSLGFFLCGGVAVLVVGVGMWCGVYALRMPPECPPFAQTKLLC